ncbi:MAG: beta-lactamase family protein [Gemmatimonadetes bacterium]|nr:beta-lactamase family protein [Gemmatimonadota bacterium]
MPILIARHLARTLLATVPVVAHAQGLPRTAPEAVGLSSDALARIAPALKAHVDSNHFAGFAFAVARHGKLAYEGAVGAMDARGTPMRTDAIFRIYSMTKAVTAAALMQQVERGTVRLTDPVSRFIPAFANTRVYAGGPSAAPTLADLARPITIEDLLLHTSGLTYGAFGNTAVDSLYRRTKLLADDYTLAQFTEALAPLPLVFQPGERWNYSMAMDVIGRVVEVASGEPFDRYLATHLFEPLGMRETGFHLPAGQEARLVTADFKSPKGTRMPGRDGVDRRLTDEGKLFSGGGGLVSTMADYLRFTQMLLNKGTLDGHRVLADRTVATMMQNHLPPRLTPVPSAAGWSGYGQGYGGIVLTDSATSRLPSSPGTYRWCGYAGTFFFVDPKRDLVGMVWGQLLGGCPSPVSDEFDRLVYGALTGK